MTFDQKLKLETERDWTCKVDNTGVENWFSGFKIVKVKYKDGITYYYGGDGMYRHCLYGPAVIIGENKKYWINGISYTKADFDRYKKLFLFM